MSYAERRAESFGALSDPSRFLDAAFPIQPRWSRPPAVEADTAATLFGVGDRVSHEKWGLGRVLDLLGAHITVSFDDGRGAQRFKVPDRRLERL